MESFEYKKQVTPLIKYKQPNQIFYTDSNVLHWCSLRVTTHPPFKNMGYLALHLDGNYNNDCQITKMVYFDSLNLRLDISTSVKLRFHHEWLSMGLHHPFQSH